MQHLHTALRTRSIAVGHLRAFLAVTQHLNFRAAAEELALTQSAVTRQIQALESEVGVALFLRHTRAVELTSAATDLDQFALIEAGDAFRRQHMEWLTWQRWLDAQGLKGFEPKRWLYFNYAHQIAQSALTGQGVALTRMPLIADSLASGALVEVLPGTRLESPLAYWLVVGPRSGERPEIKAFCAWLRAQAMSTRETIGESGPDTPRPL
jgi:DNA-binding transcriptional LysR family regulator